MKEYATVSHMTVFGMIFDPSNLQQGLFGTDKNGLLSFIGGKAEPGERDLMKVIMERESYQEARATVNPAFFDKPSRNLNLLLASATTMVFCTDDSGERIITEPWKEEGSVKIRIILAFFEVSGNAPKPYDELNKLKWIDVSSIRKRPQRKTVSHVMQFRNVVWKEFKVAQELDMVHIRKRLGKLRIDPDLIHQYTTYPSIGYWSPEAPDVTVPHHVINLRRTMSAKPTEEHRSIKRHGLLAEHLAQQPVRHTA